MRLYHFTAGEYLNGIAKFGLTVGDVPTDLSRNLGRCGVWLTSVEMPEGHGLGGALNKKSYRLAVDVSKDDPRLHRWRDWASTQVTLDTLTSLRAACGEADDSWWIYLGVIPPTAIVACRDMDTGQDVSDWAALTGPRGEVLPGVPAWRRSAWHRALLKKIARKIRRHADV